MSHFSASVHVWDVMGRQHVTIDVRKHDPVSTTRSEPVFTAQTTVPVPADLEARDWLGEALVAVMEVL